MNVSRLTFAAYDLPFRRPVNTARGMLRSRRGFLLAVFDSEGHAGIGEVATLPEFGTESVDAAAPELERLASLKEWPSCPHDVTGLAAWHQKLGLHASSHPATSFAVECALLALLRTHQSVAVTGELTDQAASVLQINALISGTRPDDVIAAADEAVSQGFRILKIKAGSRTIQEEIELLRRLHKRLPDTRFRVDANGAWSVRDTVTFAEGMAGLPVEYIEDPVAPDELDNLLRDPHSNGLKFAVDETAQSPDDLRRILPDRRCIAAVVKPPRLGSFERLANTTSLAHDQNSHIIISSLYESSVGLSYAALCAAAYGSLQFAHGLGTAALLAEDTLIDPLLPSNSILKTPEVRDLSARLQPRYQRELGVPS